MYYRIEYITYAVCLNPDRKLGYKPPETYGGYCGENRPFDTLQEAKEYAETLPVYVAPTPEKGDTIYGKINHYPLGNLHFWRLFECGGKAGDIELIAVSKFPKFNPATPIEELFFGGWWC